MNQGPELVLLVADLDIEMAVKALLETRTEALRIRRVHFKIIKDVLAGHDGGTYKHAHKLLVPFSRDPRCRALVLFDREGAAAPDKDAGFLAADVERRLRPAWGERARCIVLDPEVEVWVFSDSPHVDRELGWPQGGLREWLCAQGLWPKGQAKPPDPKLAMRRALRQAGRKPSSSYFANLAGKVGLDRCTDPSFKAFCSPTRTCGPSIA